MCRPANGPSALYAAKIIFPRHLANASRELKLEQGSKNFAGDHARLKPLDKLIELERFVLPQLLYHKPLMVAERRRGKLAGK
jgi:hypothetical protein